jgi:Fe-S cluster assembly protein SufD
VAELTTIRDTTAAPYAAVFAQVRGSLPGAGVRWLDELRARAMARFAETGFPTIRDEAWKYTDLRRLARASFATAPATPPSVSRPALTPWLVDGAAPVAVYVDGRFAPSLSSLDGLPTGVRLLSLAQVLGETPALVEGHLGKIVDPNMGLAALNTAMMQDGAVLVLDKGTTIDRPLQMLHLASDGGSFALHPRLLVIAGENSAATLVESFAALGGAQGFTDAVAEIAVGPGARIRHVRLQEESVTSWHVGLTGVRIARDAGYDGFVVNAGARLSRTEIRVRLDGRGAECRLDGATLMRGRQHADVTTDIEHASGHATSRQQFKAVLDDQSRSVFQGRVVVDKDARRTDAQQSNRNLLLSHGARADSKPELIINADDVKCSHGATVGDLDRNALFYLRARGIDEVTARSLLVEGFVRELVDAVADVAVRGRIERSVADWLAGMDRAREAA